MPTGTGGYEKESRRARIAGYSWGVSIEGNAGVNVSKKRLRGMYLYNPPLDSNIEVFSADGSKLKRGVCVSSPLGNQKSEFVEGNCAGQSRRSRWLLGKKGEVLGPRVLLGKEWGRNAYRETPGQ